MIITGTPRPHDASCLPYCAVSDSKPNRSGLPDGGAKHLIRPWHSGHVSSGNSGLSPDASCSPVGSSWIMFSPQTNRPRVSLEPDWDRRFNKVSVRLFNVFTHSQTNCIKEVNAPGIDSTEPNEAGVKTPSAGKLTFKTFRSSEICWCYIDFKDGWIHRCFLIFGWQVIRSPAELDATGGPIDKLDACFLWRVLNATLC